MQKCIKILPLSLDFMVMAFALLPRKRQTSVKNLFGFFADYFGSTVCLSAAINIEIV